MSHTQTHPDQTGIGHQFTIADYLSIAECPPKDRHLLLMVARLKWKRIMICYADNSHESTNQLQQVQLERRAANDNHPDHWSLPQLDAVASARGLCSLSCNWNLY